MFTDFTELLEKLFDDDTDYYVMNFYLKKYHNSPVLKQGVHISNPFLGEKQKTPSFNLFKYKKEKWKYKDFATNETGDVYDLIQKLFSIDFIAAKSKIKEDFDLIGEYITEVKQLVNNQSIVVGHVQGSSQNPSPTNFRLIKREFDIKDKEYWYDKHKIPRDLLNRYGVIPIQSFYRNGKHIIPRSICYAYSLGNSYKIYQPLDKKYKFQYLGAPMENFIFGYNQLPTEGDIIFITGGQKDVITIASQGFPAICLNSETAKFPDWLHTDLKKRFKEIIVLYDNDETGKAQSEKLCKEFDLTNLTLPEMEAGKDISDYIAHGFDLPSLIKFQLPKNKNSDYSLISFAELAAIGKSQPSLKRIWGDYIFENSLILFPSERGIGKTFFILELAIAVTSGYDSFCGEPIEKHGNTLYINLELSELLLSKRLTKLFENVQIKTSNFNAQCLTINGNFYKRLKKIENEIKKLKPVLVIIDNLRAASNHLDNEKNKAVVGFISELKELINTYNCSIILVHHTKKGTQNQRLNSDMQSGAGALTDLVDGDFFLSRSSKDINYRLLKRLKSRNSAEQEYPKLLFFNPDTFWFELIEESVEESEHIIYENSADKKNKTTLEMKKLYEAGKTLEEIAELLGVHKSTVSRRLK
ncbi:MAG: hypothetical protein EWV82_03735 [Microcystis aeruginosa Ma_AC_P_19900807_S299]|nr:MAG: hypothetical protein EWV82_03735 [Microcystis aeruginosa Ma_AC_P_19900807_S299]